MCGSGGKWNDLLVQLLGGEKSVMFCFREGKSLMFFVLAGENPRFLFWGRKMLNFLFVCLFGGGKSSSSFVLGEENPCHFCFGGEKYFLGFCFGGRKFLMILCWGQKSSLFFVLEEENP